MLKLPEVANLNSLGMLCSNDAEVDFFNNIIHLQVCFLCYFLLRLHMFLCLLLSETVFISCLTCDIRVVYV